MNDFRFLHQYLLPNEKESNNPLYLDLKHTLFPLNEEEIEKVDSIITIPLELKKFYTEIGYGFFFQSNSYSFDRLLDPYSFKLINLREDFYEFDPDLELYESSFYNDKVIFFEVNEGVYLLIDKLDKNDKNPIYYFDIKIADSLEEFVVKFDKEGHYFESYI